MCKYLASGELLTPILLGLRKDTRVKHGSVSSLGPVLSAQHSERKLGVVNHGGHNQLGLAQLLPVSPRPLDPTLAAQVPARITQITIHLVLVGVLGGFGANSVVVVEVGGGGHGRGSWRERGSERGVCFGEKRESGGEGGGFESHEEGTGRGPRPIAATGLGWLRRGKAFAAVFDWMSRPCFVKRRRVVIWVGWVGSDPVIRNRQRVSLD